MVVVVLVMVVVVVAVVVVVVVDFPARGGSDLRKKSGWGARGEGAAPPPAMRAMRLAPRCCFLPIVWIDFDGVTCYCCCLLLLLLLLLLPLF